MAQLTRRGFVQSTLAAGALLTWPGMKAHGANDAINVGFIGVGGRGAHSASWFAKIPGVRIAALCDADSKTLANAAKRYPDAKTMVDMRQMIEDKTIDAVCISTCNHWHALAAVWACQAGKDVYVEKPVSHNVWEGRQIVAAARKYGRIVQGGTQQRSDPVQQEIKDFVHGGQIGKIQYVRGNRYGVRQNIGKRSTPLTPPSEVDYNLWLGPAADEPMMREKFHYDWHWVWNTGNGEMGNWGVHILDDIRNTALLDKSTLPNRIFAGGARIAYNDAGESPNLHFAYFDTGSIPVLFELSNLPVDSDPKHKSLAPNYKGIRSGYVIHCEGGYYAGGRAGGQACDKDGKVIKKFKGDGGNNHAKNFIDAMRSRKPEQLAAEIEEIHYSSSWCHLANLGFQVGGSYNPDQARAAIKGVEAWPDVIDTFEKHVVGNGAKPTDAAIRMGAVLEIDPKKETFVGPTATPQALALLRREYRKGFVMPEQV
jgi:hypothetical protein